MANEKHVALLKQGVEGWNAWRDAHRDIRVDLSGAHLDGANLLGADLCWADLAGASLRGVDLGGANLLGAILREAHLAGAALDGANLFEADLREAHLDGASLDGASLDGANLAGMHLRGADLRETYLRGAILSDTLFVNVNLTGAQGLDQCRHGGPSTVDHRTLEQSGPLPLSFLRGCGLPERLIDYLPSILEQAIQFYSCFISYSSKDEEFARRLHADLQDKGVRCWFAPHDMPIGAKIWDTIDEAIRLRDKVLLILSKSAIASDWVEDEVSKAFAEERERKQVILFPVRLDDTVMQTPEAWARKLRDQRNIGDFCQWKDHDAYQKALNRLLRDLTVDRGASPP